MAPSSLDRVRGPESDPTDRVGRRAPSPVRGPGCQPSQPVAPIAAKTRSTAKGVSQSLSPTDCPRPISLKNSIRPSKERSPRELDLSEWPRIDDRPVGDGRRTPENAAERGVGEFFNEIGQQRTSVIDSNRIDLRIKTRSSLCLSRCFGRPLSAAWRMPLRRRQPGTEAPLN